VPCAAEAAFRARMVSAAVAGRGVRPEDQFRRRPRRRGARTTVKDVVADNKAGGTETPPRALNVAGRATIASRGLRVLSAGHRRPTAGLCLGARRIAGR